MFVILGRIAIVGACLMGLTMFCCIKVGADSEKSFKNKLDRPDLINTKNKKKDRSSR